MINSFKELVPSPLLLICNFNCKSLAIDIMDSDLSYAYFHQLHISAADFWLVHVHGIAILYNKEFHNLCLTEYFPDPRKPDHHYSLRCGDSGYSVVNVQILVLIVKISMFGTTEIIYINITTEFSFDLDTLMCWLGNTRPNLKITSNFTQI